MMALFAHGGQGSHHHPSFNFRITGRIILLLFLLLLSDFGFAAVIARNVTASSVAYKDATYVFFNQLIVLPLPEH